MRRVLFCEEIREGKENIVWIDLKQITNHIQVIVHNLNDKKKHIIYIEDNNGKYDSFLQYADDEKITYLPTYSNPSNTTSSLIADFTVMKLDKNREPRLKISDDTGVIRYDENLIGKLLQKNLTLISTTIMTLPLKYHSTIIFL